MKCRSVSEADLQILKELFHLWETRTHARIEGYDFGALERLHAAGWVYLYPESGAVTTSFKADRYLRLLERIGERVLNAEP